MAYRAVDARRGPRASASQRPASRLWWLVALLDVTWAAGLTTQFVGARLGYHQHLGTWLFRAPPGAARPLEDAVVACVTAALGLLLTVRRRWVGVLTAFLGLSAMAIWDGPIYAPTRVFVWYAAYREMPTYTALFRTAWVILAGTSLTLIVASWRLATGAAVRAIANDPPTRDDRRPWVQRSGGPDAPPVRTPRRAMARAGRDRGRSRTI